MVLLGIALCPASPRAEGAQTPDVSSAKRERADELVEEGNRLGAAGTLDDAITRFKEADLLVPRAIHACNLGLAYSRQLKWVDAHFYLRVCRRRWNRFSCH